jgi:ubiquitin-protein ligase
VVHANMDLEAGVCLIRVCIESGSLQEEKTGRKSSSECTSVDVRFASLHCLPFLARSATQTELNVDVRFETGYPFQPPVIEILTGIHVSIGVTLNGMS